jgi:citrate lyase subunit beta/citryl-CoA lyase
MHPSKALFQDQEMPKFLPVCDHFSANEKLMRKSMALQNKLGPIFDMTFDCEVGTSISNEKSQILLIEELLNSEFNQFNRIGVRIHDFSNLFFKSDVINLVGRSAHKIAYLVIPKVTSYKQCLDTIEFINSISNQHGVSNLPIHVLIETQSAVQDTSKIAAHPQVECLSFGIMGYISSHFGAIPDSVMNLQQQFSHPLIMRAEIEISANCHLYGKAASDNVTTDFKDVSMIREDAKRTYQECGITRLWSIHPNQIKPIIEALTPSFLDIKDSINISKFTKINEWGPIEFKGRLHDRASYLYYLPILKKASMSAIKLQSETMSFI